MTSGGGRTSADRSARPGASALDDARALAANWRWTWDPESRAVLRELCGDAWGPSGENPLACLAGAGAEASRAPRSASLDARISRCAGDLASYLAAGPEADASGLAPDTPVAYLCAEFGLGAALPTYSGGLGVLAGDHLRAASDLRLPLAGVGLLYRHGYARQTVRAGAPPESGPDAFDPASRALDLLVGEGGGPLEVRLDLRPPVVLRAWRAAVGRVPLYLLDADHDANPSAVRESVRSLYGGDAEARVVQELVLGFGAVALLEALGVRPSVWHVNEGHGAFAGLARLRRAVLSGRPFDEAREEVRATTAFTTHTPVAAGHDRFDPAVVRRLLPPDDRLGAPWASVLALARNPTDPGAFDMTALATRLASRVNGVSERHREVSRALLAPLSEDGSPPRVDAVTNGVHPGVWTDEDLVRLVARGRSPPTGDDFAANAPSISLEALWDVRRAARRRLVEAVRTQVRWGLGPAGVSPSVRARMEEGLDEDALWIGFARRFAAYKRADLAFADPARLRAILRRDDRPVRLVLAGKAHPADERAKEILGRVAALAASDEWAGRVYLLEGYDLALARVLVQGADVWLNTPRAPLEACGTSGMKAAANGGLNLSVPDGWWPEAADGTNGWTIGRGATERDEVEQDAADAAALYGLLEEEVVPSFFRRDADGLPREWLGRVVRSLATVPPRFDAVRMVRRYRDEAYRPLAAAARARGGQGAARPI